MQKKLSLALSIMLFAGLTTSVNADWSGAKKVASIAGVCLILGGGQYVDKMNKEYATERKDPDLKLALAKSTAAAAMLIGVDMLLNDHDTAQNLVKIGAFTVALAAGTDTVAHVVNNIPSVGAILTGPIVDGKEVKDSGAAARVIISYMGLRQWGLNTLAEVTSSSTKKNKVV